MQYINSTFHERIKDGITPQYIRLHFTDINGLPCVFENEDFAGEVQIDQYFCTGEELKFGDTPSNTISFTLLNENQRLAGFPFGDCSAYIGVETRSEGGSFPSGAKAYVYTQRGSHLIVDDQGFKVGTGAVDYVVRGTFVSLCVFESMVYLLTPTRVLVFQETAQNTVISVGQTVLRPNVYLQKFMSRPMGVYWHGQYLETWDALDTHSHKTFSFAGLGTYYCERPVNTKTGTIDFSDQHDRMVEMDADAAEALAEFETNDTLNDIAITMWGNSDVIASINPYATVEQEYNPFYTAEVRTKRDVLSKIAERLRSVAMVRNGKLTFRALGTSPVERIGETDIAMGSFVAHDVPIELTTGVLLKSGNASLAYGDLTNPYYIYANPLITEITASDLEAYKALPNYYPCSFEIINADPAVEVGDLINIEGLINAFIMIANSDNEAVVSTDTVAYATWQPLNAVPLLQRTIHFNGHCSAEYRIPGRQKHEIPDNVAANAALSLEEVKQLDNSLTQQEIFDRLTDGGQAQGIYLQDGKIYVNAEYIKAGVLTGVEINNGNGTFRVDENGNMGAKSGSIGGWSIDDNTIYKDVTFSGVPYQVGLFAPAQPENYNTVFYVGYQENGVWKYPFRVTYTGKVVANDIDITGGTIALQSNTSDDSRILLRGYWNSSTHQTYLAPDKVVAYYDDEGGTTKVGGLYPDKVYIYSDGAHFKSATLSTDGVRFEYDNESLFYPARQTTLFNTTTVDGTLRNGTCSGSIYSYHEIAVVLVVDSYKTVLTIPKAEFGTAHNYVTLFFSPTWYMTVDIRFSSGTAFTYQVVSSAGITSTNKRLSIIGK